MSRYFLFFFFQAEDGIRDSSVTGVQTCALPICLHNAKHFALRLEPDAGNLRQLDVAAFYRYPVSKSAERLKNSRIGDVRDLAVVHDRCLIRRQLHGDLLPSRAAIRRELRRGGEGACVSTRSLYATWPGVFSLALRVR